MHIFIPKFFKYVTVTVSYFGVLLIYYSIFLHQLRIDTELFKVVNLWLQIKLLYSLFI